MRAHRHSVMGKAFALAFLGLWPMLASAQTASLNPAADPDAAGWEAFQRGAFEEAAQAWAAAAMRYGQRGQTTQQIDALLQAAESYQALGRYQLAAQSIEQAQVLAAS